MAGNFLWGMYAECSKQAGPLLT